VYSFHRHLECVSEKSDGLWVCLNELYCPSCNDAKKSFDTREREFTKCYNTQRTHIYLLVMLQEKVNKY